MQFLFRFLQGGSNSIFICLNIVFAVACLHDDVHQDVRKVSAEKESFLFKAFAPLVQASRHKCRLILLSIKNY